VNTALLPQLQTTQANQKAKAVPFTYG